MNINLGAIKSTIPFFQGVFQFLSFESSFEIFLCFLPILWCAGKLFRAGGKFEFITEAKRVIKFHHHSQDFGDLSLDLVLGGINMSIIHGQLSDAQETIHLATFLAAVESAYFRESK